MTKTPHRTRLPNRRPNQTRTFDMHNRVVDVTVGFGSLAGLPREVFIRDRKEGSALSALLDDASVAISVALQYGVPAAALARSIGRVPVATLAPAELDACLARGGGDKAAASVIGAALDWLVELAGGEA